MYLSKKSFVAILSVLLFAACASEDEKKERRENSLDVSGGYKTSIASGSEMDLQFEIKNESGRHDIVINLERFSPLTAKEKNFLKAKNIDSQFVSNYFGNRMILGQGYKSLQLDGGENISSDFGESSEFFVCTESVQYNAEYSVYYCLNGKVRKKEKMMRGNLVLRTTRREQKVENGQTVISYSLEQAESYFQSDLQQVFYKQYLGAWSGETYSLLADVNASQFQKLQIVEVGEDSFLSSFSQKIVFLGEEYLLDVSQNTQSLDLLRLSEYPAIEVVYMSKSGKKMVLFAQIWSLGELTGSVVWVDGTTLIDVAIIRLKKD
jgi:hypothetical protein